MLIFCWIDSYFAYFNFFTQLMEVTHYGRIGELVHNRVELVNKFELEVVQDPLLQMEVWLACNRTWGLKLILNCVILKHVLVIEVLYYEEICSISFTINVAKCWKFRPNNRQIIINNRDSASNFKKL